MKTLSKSAVGLALVMTMGLSCTSDAHAHPSTSGELELGATPTARVTLKLGGIPAFWQEPPGALPLQFQVTLRSPLLGLGLSQVAGVHHEWRARGLWPEPVPAHRPFIGLGGALGLPELRWLTQLACPNRGLALPVRPCTLQVGLTLRA